MLKDFVLPDVAVVLAGAGFVVVQPVGHCGEAALTTFMVDPL